MFDFGALGTQWSLLVTQAHAVFEFANNSRMRGQKFKIIINTPTNLSIVELHISNLPNIGQRKFLSHTLSFFESIQ